MLPRRPLTTPCCSWSPNHPAQALAALALRVEYLPMVVNSGVLPLLVDIIRPSEPSKQAEPARDERYALQALKVLGQRLDLIQHVPDVAELVVRVFREGQSPVARALAQEAAEALGVTTLPLPLQLRCRQVLRQTWGKDFDVYTRRVMEAGLPEHMARFLMYEER